MPTIIKDILFYRRKYFIEKVKAPLLKAITILAGRYPEPTKENTVWKNSRRLIDIREKLKKYHINPGRQALMDAAIKALIDEYEHDGYYAFLLDWFIAEIAQSGWEIEERGFPMWRYWNGPLLAQNLMESDNEFLTKNRKDWLEKSMRLKLGEIPLNMQKLLKEEPWLKNIP
jgi:hypothetical protein